MSRSRRHPQSRLWRPRPPSPKRAAGAGRSLGPLGHLVCHCLLIEHEGGLILVDTGYGLKGVDHPHRQPDPRITRVMRSMLNIRLRESETAARQIEALGFKASDVRHILLTHLDSDHAGGLEDFPAATIHVMAREHDEATGPRRGFVPRNRYRPSQFDEVRDWQLHGGPDGEPWFGFEPSAPSKGCRRERLRALSVDRAADAKLVCAHDPTEFEGCAAGKPL